MRLLLVRHGETDWNAERRFQGHTDRPLSAIGLRQAEAVARAVAEFKPVALFSSDLLRARVTAEAAARATGLTLQTDPALRECSFGAWEGLTFDQIQTLHPEAYAEWQRNAHHSPPGGESIVQVATRMSDAVAHIREKFDGQVVALVAHGGCLQAMLCHALGIPPRAFWPFRLEPASLSELALYEPGPVLYRVNDTHHLHELDGGKPGAASWVR